jgi:hypothetical protein
MLAERYQSKPSHLDKFWASITGAQFFFNTFIEVNGFGKFCHTNQVNKKQCLQSAMNN